MARVDLNADVGESFGAWSLGDDAGVMRHVTSANIACGFHAGDPSVMRATVALAIANGVAIGAHPSLPDLAGFGRREMRVSPREVEDMVVYQVAALAGIAAAHGGRVRHVKPHGALYNMAAREATLADAIARATAAVDRALVLFGLAGSALIEAGERAGLRTASEIFADRAYEPDATLTPRSRTGAMIEGVDAVAERAVAMVRDRAVTAVDGTRVRVRPETICIHGDAPGAAAVAAAVRRALTKAGIEVAAV